MEYFVRHRGNSVHVIGNLGSSRNSFITRICVVVVTIREDVICCCRSTERRIALEKGGNSNDDDVNPCPHPREKMQ